MKKIVTVMMALVMVLSLSVTALAAPNEMSYNEQKIYDKFCQVVDRWYGFNQKSVDRGTQYKSKAKQSLLIMYLSKSQCDDLEACIDRVDAFIASKEPKSAHDMKMLALDVEKIVNETSNKYGIKVVLDANLYADVLIKLKDGTYKPVGDVTGNDDSDLIIRQTGFDFAATVVVGMVLVTALGVSLLVVGKKRLLSVD